MACRGVRRRLACRARGRFGNALVRADWYAKGVDVRQGRRARPVADAPVAALVAGAESLARDWLVALMAQTPLAAAARVPVAELAGEAPRLCAAVVRALASDDELDRLDGGDLAPLAARAGALAGAAEPADAAGAVELLRGVVWTAALGELRRPSPELVADLAARLAVVAAVVTAASLRRAGATASASVAGREAAAPPAPDAGSAAGRAPEAAPATDAAFAAAPVAGRESDARSGPDASASAPAAGLAPDAPSDRDRASAPAPMARLSEADQFPPPVAPHVAADGDPDAAGVEARDLRPRILDGAPLDHLADRVSAHLTDQRTLAVLLVELDGVDRLLAAGEDAQAAIAQAEAAIETLLRQGDGARRDGPGRVWVTLPGTGPAGARALALRIAVAVEHAAVHRGVPLTATTGIAVFPADAIDAHGLADRAEEALLTARASGVH